MGRPNHALPFSVAKSTPLPILVIFTGEAAASFTGGTGFAADIGSFGRFPRNLILGTRSAAAAA